MSPKASHSRTSALAVAVMIGASSAAADLGRTSNGADPSQFTAIENTWAQAGRRRLQGTWCTVVSDTETYCCGFGGRADCLSRGLEYTGPVTPCEVKLVSDSDGVSRCEGFEGTSGNVERSCNCADLTTDPPTTEAPAATPMPDVMTPMPMEMMTPMPVENATPMPMEMMTPMPAMEGETMMPAGDMTPMPAMDGETMMPAAVDVPVVNTPTAAPTPGSRDISFTMAPTDSTMTMAPSGVTMAPSSAPTMMTMAPTMSPTMSTGVPTMAPTMMPTAMPTVGSRDLFIPSGAPTSAPTGAPTLFPPSFTLPPDVTLPPVLVSGSSALSTSSLVTFMAVAGGLFAAFAAARE